MKMRGRRKWHFDRVTRYMEKQEAKQQVTVELKDIYDVEDDMFKDHSEFCPCLRRNLLCYHCGKPNDNRATGVIGKAVSAFCGDCWDYEVEDSMSQFVEPPVTCLCKGDKK